MLDSVSSCSSGTAASHTVVGSDTDAESGRVASTSYGNPSSPTESSRDSRLRQNTAMAHAVEPDDVELGLTVIADDSTSHLDVGAMARIQSSVTDD